ncbi:MAG: lipoprotein ABC transporter permease [Cellvibrionaceae bacterium]|nr:lipoprotein ABC transporter permease [Cellvibrionaceae bacterium]|tara:strand:+ start:7375 stop:8658 length:1284 start_codon:yes stop_codon:yes gene_type:complete
MLTSKLAWRNLWRHPRRTWLTIAAMVFSNVLLVFMISMQFGMYHRMIDNTLRLMTGHLQVQLDGYQDLPRIHKVVPNIEQLAEDLRRLSAQAKQLSEDSNQPNVEQPPSIQVAARAQGFALVSSQERSYGAMIIGVQPDYEGKISSLPGLVKQGDYLSSDSDAEVVIGLALARNLKVTLGDELTLLGSGRDGSFVADVVRVRGLFDSGVADLDRNLIHMPLKRFQESFAMGESGHQLVIMSEDFYQLDTLKSQLQPALSLQPKLKLLDWQELQPGLRQAIIADMASAWFMYGVLILLVAFSVLNTQLMSVLERTREFGIVMSLGLRPNRLGGLVMLESLLMASIGLALGMLLGVALVTYLNQNGFIIPGTEEAMARYNMPSRIYPSLNAGALLLGPSIVWLGCLLASLYPALRLQFLHPIEAMRSSQ